MALEFQGILVGYACTDVHGDQAQIIRLAVDPLYQGMGLGRHPWPMPSICRRDGRKHGRAQHPMAKSGLAQALSGLWLSPGRTSYSRADQAGSATMIRAVVFDFGWSASSGTSGCRSQLAVFDADAGTADGVASLRGSTADRPGRPSPPAPFLPKRIGPRLAPPSRTGYRPFCAFVDPFYGEPPGPGDGAAGLAAARSVESGAPFQCHACFTPASGCRT